MIERLVPTRRSLEAATTGGLTSGARLDRLTVDELEQLEAALEANPVDQETITHFCKLMKQRKVPASDSKRRFHMVSEGEGGSRIFSVLLAFEPGAPGDTTLAAGSAQAEQAEQAELPAPKPMKALPPGPPAATESGARARPEPAVEDPAPALPSEAEKPGRTYGVSDGVLWRSKARRSDHDRAWADFMNLQFSSSASPTANRSFSFSRRIR